MAMFNRAYKAKISSWRNILPYYINISSHPSKEETKVVFVKMAPPADEGKMLATPSSKKRNAFAD